MGALYTDFAIDAAGSYLGWWRDAGFDAAAGEMPHDWLATKPVPASRVDVAPIPALPASHGAFVDWLMTAELPEAGPPAQRLKPAGDPASDLMILVDFPDRADLAEGRPFAGMLAPLFELMLAAIGRTRATTYIAALCPGRPLTGWLSDETVAALAATARHHVGLVAPRQLWLMGGAASRAILGIGDARAKGRLHNVNLVCGNVDVIATAHPRMFEDSKTRKAAAWAEMQRLLNGDRA